MTGAAGGGGSSCAARRARSNSGTAPMITAAEIAITAYSSQGVSESACRLRHARSKVDERHRRRDTCAERRQPDRGARAQQDAVDRSNSAVSGPLADRAWPAASVLTGISSSSARRCWCSTRARCRRWS